MVLRADYADGREYNEALATEFRANGGVTTGDWEGKRLLIITTTGSKSGNEHMTPLGFSMDGDRYVISAANGGAPKHPAWYHNLVANPIVTVEVGPETFQARAIVSEGADRDRLVVERSKSNPAFIRNQERAGSRQIPLVWLERI
jgi:deazaflavin-dependent oxidoreductase (nitroreductase family)